MFASTPFDHAKKQKGEGFFDPEIKRRVTHTKKVCMANLLTSTCNFEINLKKIDKKRKLLLAYWIKDHNPL